MKWSDGRPFDKLRAGSRPSPGAFTSGFKQPVQHRPERRNPGSRSDHQSIPQRRPQNEIAERTLKRNLGPFAQIAQVIRHEPVLHAIQAKSKPPILRRRRCNRVRPCDLLTLRRAGFHRKPLPGDEPKPGHSLHFEFDVLGKLGERNRAQQLCGESLELEPSSI